MPSLRLESATDSLDLDSVFFTDEGVQALSGATGLGLIPVAGQWLEGAGDGASYRGGRTPARDMDLPLLIGGKDREGLKSWFRRLGLVLADEATLVFVDDRAEEWFCKVRHVGGGDFSYGIDTTGARDLTITVTLRSGDPFWTRTVPYARTIETADGSRGLLSGGSLSQLQLSTTQTFGALTFNNPGDAPAYPVWKVYGPATEFTATNSAGEIISWSGVLDAGEVMTIDHKLGTVKNQNGEDLYDGLADFPQFWAIPPDGSSGSVVLVGGVVGSSKVTYTWQPRRKAVI